MSDLGSLLKKARFEKGIDLDQLQESTKIQKRYLEAIENGEFHVLPGTFYVRAFIKSYSEAVGLNPDEVLRLYRDVLPNRPTANTEPVHHKKRRRSFNSDRFSKWITTTLMWSFALIIAVLVYVYVNYIHEPKPAESNADQRITEDFELEDEPPETIVSPEPIIVPPVEEEPPLLEPEVTYVSTDNPTYIYNVSHVDTLEMEITIVGDKCWVQLKEGNKDGQDIVMTTYSKDDIITWEVDHSLWLRMGNPSAVEVRINGILIEGDKLLESNPWNLQINYVDDAIIE